MSRFNRKLISLISAVLSFVAICISIRSCKISQQNLQYNINRNTMIDTPALKEVVDSTSIAFSLNGDNAILQGLCVYFPSEVEKSPYAINFKPFCIHKNYLERMVENYLYKFVKSQDSLIIVGTWALPVMIDYSAIVYGFPYELRENRTFVFTFVIDSDLIKVNFSNTCLVQRCSYPLKKHWFYYGPFSSSLVDKVNNQDKYDIQEMLQRQLEFADKDLRKMLKDEKSY